MLAIACPRRGRGRGLTLVEVLVVISIASILAAVAVPGFSAFMDRRRADGASDALQRGLLLARAEAQARGATVLFCGGTDGSCATDFAAGFRVFVDLDRSGSFSAGDLPVQVVQPPAGTRVSNDLGGAFVAFQPSGFPAFAAAIPGGSLVVTAGDYQRRVCLSRSGVVLTAPARAAVGPPPGCG